MDMEKLKGPEEEAVTSPVETMATGNHVMPQATRSLRNSRHSLSRSTHARAKAPAIATY